MTANGYAAPMHAVILAGGEGSRLRPLTDTRPKPLVPFMGAPFAVGLLMRLRDAGCDRATFLVGASVVPFAQLRTLGQRLGIVVELVAEESPLDTAGAVRRVLRGTSAPVLICNGDILTDMDYRALLAEHDRAGAVVTIALTQVDDPSSFGVVTTDDSGRITRFVEKPPAGESPADTVNAGTYVTDPLAFDEFEGDGPLSFERDVFPSLLEAGAVLHGAMLPAYWGDLGTPERLRAGHAAVLDGRCVWPSVADLRWQPPEAAVHSGAEIAGTATIDGGSVVGERVRVGERATVHGALLFDGAEVRKDARVDRAIVGPGAIVGAGAQVGVDAVVGDGARVADGATVPDGARVLPQSLVAAD
jgi:mannose-1-phosphate guanylyltransferase